MLEGKWVLVGGEQNGQVIPESDLGKYKMVITGNEHLVTWTNAELKGTHQLDTSQTPNTIDASDTAGPFEGMKVHGIFKAEGDLFTVCFSEPGSDRPSEFTTQGGQATILHVWKKAN